MMGQMGMGGGGGGLPGGANMKDLFKMFGGGR